MQKTMLEVPLSPREDEENPLASIILGLPAETWVCETEVKRRK
jgi:hypothetical protein